MYDSILVIVDQLIIIVYYKPVIMTIDILALADVIITNIVQHYHLLASIVYNSISILILKVWSLLR